MGDLTIGLMICAGLMDSFAPVLVTAMLPSAASRSTRTGMIGARMVVEIPDCGEWPTIEKGHTDWGLPFGSKPGAVNWPTQLATESMPGTPTLAAAVFLPSKPLAPRAPTCVEAFFRKSRGTEPSLLTPLTAACGAG